MSKTYLLGFKAGAEAVGAYLRFAADSGHHRSTALADLAKELCPRAEVGDNWGYGYDDAILSAFGL